MRSKMDATTPPHSIRRSVLMAMLICVALGAGLLIPSLVLLYAIGETSDSPIDTSAGQRLYGRAGVFVADRPLDEE